MNPLAPQSTTRTVVIGPSSERHRGGIAQFTSRLVSGLKESRSVEFYSWKELYPRLLLKREIAQESAQLQSGTHFTLSYSNPRSWTSTAEKIAALDPQKIILTWSHPVNLPVYLYLLHAFRKKCRAELVCIAHNVLPHESFPGMKSATKSCLKRFDRIIVHSENDEREMHGLLPRAKVVRLFLPLFDFLPNAGAVAECRENRLLFFGSQRPYKGLDILLKAMPAVLDKLPDAKLRIAGEKFYSGGFFARFQHKDDSPLALIEQLQLANSVTLDSRYIPDAELSTLFSQCAVAVFPFRDTNQSGSLNLAFAYGVPAVATRVGGLAEYVFDGKNGMLVEPENPAALAEGILRLLERPIERASVVASSKKFSWELYLYEFCEKVLDAPGFEPLGAEQRGARV